MLNTHMDTSTFKYAIQRQWLSDGGDWIVYRQDVWFKLFSFKFKYWKKLGTFSNESEARDCVDQDLDEQNKIISGL